MTGVNNPPGVPIATAAKALGVPVGTMRRWVREGCPTLSKGRRGRGHRVLIDLDAVRQWRSAGVTDRIYLTLAEAVPELLAKAAEESLRMAEGFDKRRLAGVIAGSWYLSSTAMLDHLRAKCAHVPELTTVPERIELLRKIAR